MKDVKVYIIFLIFSLALVLMFISISGDNGSKKIEKIVQNLNENSIDKIICKNIKLNDQYNNIDAEINSSEKKYEFISLLKEAASQKISLGVSPNNSKQHTNCHLKNNDGNTIISVSMGYFEDGSSYASIYKSNFFVYDKKVINTKLAELIIEQSDSYFD